jgi:ribosomal protein L23
MKTTIEGGRVVCTLSEEETRILVAADGVRAQIDAAVEKYFRFVPTQVQWIRVMDDNGRLRAEAGTLEALRAGGSI